MKDKKPLPWDVYRPSSGMILARFQYGDDAAAFLEWWREHRGEQLAILDEAKPPAPGREVG